MLFTSRFPADGKRGCTVRFLSLTVNFTKRLMLGKYRVRDLVFPLRKSQGQLGIHHQLTERKHAVHVTFSSTWKTGLNSSFCVVNRKFHHTVNVVKMSRSRLLFRLWVTPGKLNIHWQ